MYYSRRLNTINLSINDALKHAAATDVAVKVHGPLIQARSAGQPTRNRSIHSEATASDAVIARIAMQYGAFDVHFVTDTFHDLAIYMNINFTNTEMKHGKHFIIPNMK